MYIGKCHLIKIYGTCDYCDKRNVPVEGLFVSINEESDVLWMCADCWKIRSDNAQKITNIYKESKL